MPRIRDRVPEGFGDGVELSLLDGLVQAGVQGVQDIHDGDKGRGGGSRLDGDAPGKPGCDNFHDLSRRVCSGHRKVSVVDVEPVWVWWEGNVKTNTLRASEDVMKRGWSRSWRRRDKVGAGVVRNNWALLHRRKCVWWYWQIGGGGRVGPGGGW